jgi:hypothetical protein
MLGLSTLLCLNFVSGDYPGERLHHKTSTNPSVNLLTMADTITTPKAPSAVGP